MKYYLIEERVKLGTVLRVLAAKNLVDLINILKGEKTCANIIGEI